MNKYLKFLAIGFLSLVFTGVMAYGKDAKDINDKLIATTIAVDKRDGEMWLFVEFANIEAQDSGDQKKSGMGAKYYMVAGHGLTLDKARENLDRQLDKPIYIGGTRTLLITENFAKEDLVEYLYRLRADEGYRKKIITVMTTEEPEKMFSKLNEQGQSLGYSIENTITTLDSSGEAFSRTTSRVLENLSHDYTGVLVPCFNLQNDYTALVGYSVVHDTKVTGMIPIKNFKGASYLKINKAKQYYIINLNQNKLSIESTLAKKQLKPLYEDGKIKITINLDVEAILKYGSQKTPYGLTDDDVKTIKKILVNKITNQVAAAVYQAQKLYKTDYLQFDDAFRSKYPVEFQSMDWDKEFPKITVTPNVKVNFSANRTLDYKTDKQK